MRWKSKKRFEHVSPYLNQEAELSWWFLATFSWRVSARWPWATERISLISSSSGSLCSWTSAKVIFCWRFLTMAPFDFFFSLAILMLHWSTLSEAAFSQDGHSES
jgi:hypothetical protein